MQNLSRISARICSEHMVHSWWWEEGEESCSKVSACLWVLVVPYGNAASPVTLRWQHSTFPSGVETLLFITQLSHANMFNMSIQLKGFWFGSRDLLSSAPIINQTAFKQHIFGSVMLSPSGRSSKKYICMNKCILKKSWAAPTIQSYSRFSITFIITHWLYWLKDSLKSHEELPINLMYHVYHIILIIFHVIKTSCSVMADSCALILDKTGVCLD